MQTRICSSRFLFNAPALSCLALSCLAADSEVVSRHVSSSDASPAFKFDGVAAPAKNDAATRGTFSVIEGAVDPNSGGLRCLTDGRLPAEEDAPGQNFFFRAGSRGGRLLLDLGREVPVSAVRSYSWHPGSRGPQTYSLYAAIGTEAGFQEKPTGETDPTKAGWQFLGKAAPPQGQDEPGGQYAVQITPRPGTNLVCRYLLLDVVPTAENDPFAHTFFSEIDVIDADAKDEPVSIAAAKALETFTSPDSNYTFALDVSETPELADWVRSRIIPMTKEWYPKVVKLLPSEGYEAPKKVTIEFKAGMRGVAHTVGTRVTCAGPWFQSNLEGEAVGAVFHEYVHVVQQYGRASRRSQVPGWLVEGIADYVRWYIYEPQTKGAEITKRNLSRAKYDASYRVTANFLNWTSEKYAKDLVPKLNANIRQGKYTKELWQEITGKPLEDLGKEWRAALEEKLGSESSGG